ncbi:MAG: E3 binding domain-containing protein, partial [Candidatus Eremiobacteraeota bacterium]|nr:E3 binding domain-containing protein [Candidatus Eremiobacteraeota bacterium]
MPQLGETVTEGTVAQWLKKPGDSVEKYEAFVEVSTDKVNAEVPSPVTGVIRELIVKEGETVPTGAPIAIIDDVAADTTPAPNGSTSPSEQVAASTAEANHQASDEPVPGGNVGLGGPSFSAPSNGLSSVDKVIGHDGGSSPQKILTDNGNLFKANGVRTSPAVRRLAREHQVNLASVSGTGT